MDWLNNLRNEGMDMIESINDVDALEQARVNLLGRKGALTAKLRSLKDLPDDERPQAGAALNKLRQEFEAALNVRKNNIDAEKDADMAQGCDLTLPGIAPIIPGSRHPLTAVINEICDIFFGMGFSREDGPDIELDYYNFTALNFPDDHPARDIQDTFYINDKVLLRTQTSPAQVRIMEQQKPPLAVIVPGRVYRNEALDASHAAEFFQIEGLYVGKNVSLADLKTTVLQFVHQFYGADVVTRFRPHFFPFTEPSVEVDMECMACNGNGCTVCGKTGWLEIMGAGMVHPNVFASAGYDPDEYTGFAFGLGIDRIAMLKHAIKDIRYLYENDLRFLSQFRSVK